MLIWWVSGCVPSQQCPIAGTLVMPQGMLSMYQAPSTCTALISPLCLTSLPEPLEVSLSPFYRWRDERQEALQHFQHLDTDVSPDPRIFPRQPSCHLGNRFGGGGGGEPVVSNDFVQKLVVELACKTTKAAEAEGGGWTTKMEQTAPAG